MQQFVVPQFIDVEDKVIGFITTRQFLILLVTGLVIFLSYKLFTFLTFLVITVVLLGIALIIAFVRVNGQPFHFFLLNILQTARRPALQVWRREYTSAELRVLAKTEAPVATETTLQTKAQYGHSRLNELALIVDTGGAYRGEAIESQVNWGKSSAPIDLPL